jgi:hypothetical protein
MAIDRAIILDPPTFTSFEFEVTNAPGSPGGNFVYGIWIENDPDPPEFSATHLPSVVVASGNVIEVVPAGTVHAGILPGETITASVDLAELFTLYRQSSWNGTINVIFEAYRPIAPLLQWRWYSHLSTSDPTRLVTEEIAFVAGLSGYDVHAQSRVDRCDRCGSYDLRERFTDDGYSKGLSVCRDCWDPEDPPTRPIPPDLPPIND